MKVKVHVALKKSVLDPQGKTISQSLQRIGYEKLKDVRVGKEFYLEIDSDNEEEVLSMAKEMAEKLLANTVIEDYYVEVDKQ